MSNRGKEMADGRRQKLVVVYGGETSLVSVHGH